MLLLSTLSLLTALTYCHLLQYLLTVTTLNKEAIIGAIYRIIYLT